MKNWIEKYKWKMLMKGFEETKRILAKSRNKIDDNVDCHASPMDGCEHCIKKNYYGRQTH